ncbi:MAG: immunoglobulin-like domain-containing protein [Candidatus Hydrogenedentota bacterium]
MKQPKSAFTVAFVLTACLVASAVGAQTVTMTREVTGLDEDGLLIPGTTSIDVTIAVEVDGDPEQLTALGIEERYPEDWSFAGVSGDCVPPVANETEAGVLGLAWTTIPSFPCEFTYTLDLPDTPSLPASIEGEPQYRVEGQSDAISGTTTEQEFPLLLVERTLTGPGVTGSDNQFFVPGETLTVEVVISKAGDTVLTALGMEETYPEDWSFAGVSGDCVPPVANETAAGELGIAWTTIPEFPCSFSYSIDIPEDATGDLADPAILTGTPQFRVEGTSDAFTGETETFEFIEAACLDFTRDAPTGYSPGDEFTVTLTVGADCPEDITAFAIEETVPAGWSFVEASGTPAPGNLPAAGEEGPGPYNFVWFEVPAALNDGDPETTLDLTYTMDVPADDTGEKTISGVVLYRLAGGQLVSDTVNTTILDVDTEDPVPACQDIEASLDPDGQASIAPEDLDGGTTDNFGVDGLTFEASQTDFTCADLGENTVTLTVTDEAGNSATCDATVTVVDTIDPAVTCQDAQVALDADGTATITAEDVVASSTDNCAIDSTDLSQTSFTCAEVGENTVTVTVTDAAGNTGTCEATVTVVDDIDPTVTTLDATAALDAAGSASISTADVVDTAADNCAVESVILSQDTFGCADVGANTVTVTVTDVNGNTASAEATVTVEDNIAPTVTPLDVEVALDANGGADISTEDVVAESGDNCGIDAIQLSKDTFGCADLGANVVTVTATDVNGNATTAEATVTVTDDIAPTIECQDIEVALDEDGAVSVEAEQVVAQADDNCVIASVELSESEFGCSDIGPNPVTVTATDEAGNIAECDATITVTGDPVAICQDVSVSLDEDGLATVTAEEVDNGSFAPCGDIESIELSQTEFTCADVGENEVTLTVTDAEGVSAQCDAIVTVEANPLAACQDVTVQLGEDGTATLTPEEVDDGSAAVCDREVAELALDITEFTCEDEGENTVTLTVTDSEGATSTCEATITVDAAPVAVCQEAEIALDAEGRATLSVDQVDAGSFAPCGELDSRELSQTSFSCADLGTNSITLNVSAADSYDTCDTTVTVVDPVAPVITLEGDAEVSVECGDTYTDAGVVVADNCDESPELVVDNPVDTSVPDAYVVTYSAEDASGNQAATVTRTVNVVDTTPPMLDLLGDDPLEAECGADYQDPGAVATDVCDGEVAVEIDDSNVVVDQPGEYSVALSATDEAGNQGTATRTVIVVDTTGPDIELLGGETPVIDCADEYQDPGATATDACEGEVDVVIDDSNVVPDEEGVYVVSYTATDSAGNTSTVERTVVIEGPSCGPRCELGEDPIAITSPSGGNIVVESGLTEAEVTFTSQVDLLESDTADPAECDLEVTYTVDGDEVGTSVDADGGFPVAFQAQVGTEYTVQALLNENSRDLTAESAVVTFTVVSPEEEQDQDGNGIPDNPFAALPDEGDSWDSIVPIEGACDRAVKLVSFFGSAEGGEPVTATVVNPDDPTQAVTVTVPREGVVGEGEQGILIVAIACDVFSLLAPEDAGELERDLPSDSLAAGAAAVEVSVIVPLDEGEFDEVEVFSEENPVTISLGGLAFTPAWQATYFSHPTFVNSDEGTTGVVIMAEGGSWSDQFVANESTRGGVLTAEVVELSAFIPVEQPDDSPQLKVSPSTRFPRILGIVEVGDEVEATFTARNAGGGLVSGSVTLPDGPFSLIDADGEKASSIDFNLATGQSQHFTVQFAPSTSGDASATLQFVSDDVDPQSVELRGTAIPQKFVRVMGCGAAESQSSSRGDLVVVLLAAAGLVLLSQRRRVRKQ